MLLSRLLPRPVKGKCFYLGSRFRSTLHGCWVHPTPIPAWCICMDIHTVRCSQDAAGGASTNPSLGVAAGATVLGRLYSHLYGTTVQPSN